MHVKALIASNPNWLEVLEQDYKIHVVRDGDLVSLKYNQIESPMHELIVQECRGMVVDVVRNVILAHPYNKFWNHGEPLAAQIDWSTARVLEKLDGSLMTLYWDSGWQVASSGSPKAGGGFGSKGDTETFAQGFGRIWTELGMHTPGLRDVVFMFELCAPENRVVVRHDKPRIVLHGARDMRSGDEISLDDLAPIAESCNWEIVKSFPIGSIEECLKAAEELEAISHEGFVVVDAAFNRIKIKSPRYVALHHMKGDGVSTKRAVELWQSGETQELLTHFPEFAPDILPIHARLDDVAARALEDIKAAASLESRKDYAMLVKDKPWSAACFEHFDSRYHVTITDVLASMREQSLASLERILERV